jgi:hypothetical protein
MCHEGTLAQIDSGVEGEYAFRPLSPNSGYNQYSCMITPNNILAVTVATVGLKGIWGMEQLDKTGLATWKLGLILMGVAAPVCYA